MVSSVHPTAEALHHRLGMSLEAAYNIIEHMVDAGGRYVNLELQAGEGISILLGQGAETRYLPMIRDHRPY